MVLVPTSTNTLGRGGRRKVLAAQTQPWQQQPAAKMSCAPRVLSALSSGRTFASCAKESSLGVLLPELSKAGRGRRRKLRCSILAWAAATFSCLHCQCWQRCAPRKKVFHRKLRHWRSSATTCSDSRSIPAVPRSRRSTLRWRRGEASWISPASSERILPARLFRSVQLRPIG